MLKSTHLDLLLHMLVTLELVKSFRQYAILFRSTGISYLLFQLYDDNLQSLTFLIASHRLLIDQYTNPSGHLYTYPLNCPLVAYSHFKKADEHWSRFSNGKCPASEHLKLFLDTIT